MLEPYIAEIFNAYVSDCSDKYGTGLTYMEYVISAGVPL